jgi:predicted enzyme related to lactoylglutathione lyase
MKSGQVCWFEIPVVKLDRAIQFYSSILNVKIEKIKLLEKENGIFKKENQLIGGVLVEKAGHASGKGPVIFFFVLALSDVLNDVTALGGKIVTPKTLIRQVDEKGNSIIAKNLIDGDTGYFSEIEDSEGNVLGLYSNS